MTDTAAAARAAEPPAPTVTLRARTPDDSNVLFRIAADLDTWEERDTSAPAPLTRQRFDGQLTGTGDAVTFVIDVDGRAVGSASLFGFDPLAHRAEAGINLVSGARGRGTGTAALVQLVEFGFVRRNLHRIHLQAIASNARAVRAYEKAGFVVEGRLREHAWVRGAYEDVVLMGVLRSERTPGA